MSLTRWVDVQCDGTLPNGLQCSMTAAVIKGCAHNAAEARAIAKDMKWVRFNGQDYCPRCWKRQRDMDMDSIRGKSLFGGTP